MFNEGRSDFLKGQFFRLEVFCYLYVFFRYGSPATDSVDISGSEMRRSMSDGNGSCGEDDLIIMEKQAEKETS